jgi:hypothetical protein
MSRIKLLDSFKLNNMKRIIKAIKNELSLKNGYVILPSNL